MFCATAPRCDRRRDGTDVSPAALRFTVGSNDHFFRKSAMPLRNCAPGRARHRQLDHGRRDGPQRHRLRHPGRRHRGRVVHRPRPARGRPVPRRYGPDDANPDIGDSSHHETAGIGGSRWRPPRDRPVRRRPRCRRPWPPPGGCTRSPSARTRAGRSGPGVPGHAHRHRRHPGVPTGSCRRSTPAWLPRRGVGQSAPVRPPRGRSSAGAGRAGSGGRRTSA